jgi:hypothetical protein
MGDAAVAIKAFSDALRGPPVSDYPYSTCCLLSLPDTFQAAPNDYAIIYRAYHRQLKHAYILQLPGCAAAVVVYCELRCRAFMPPGLGAPWHARNVKAAVGMSGSVLSDIVRRSCTPLEVAAAQHLQAAPSPMRCAVSDDTASPTARAPAGHLHAEHVALLARVEAAECDTAAAKERIIVLEEKCRSAEEAMVRIAASEVVAAAAEARITALEERCRAAERAVSHLSGEIVQMKLKSAAAPRTYGHGGALEVYPRF